MSRTIFLSLNEGEVVARCLAEKVGVSAIERLPGGGVRLVCMSSEGAGVMARKFKQHLMADTVAREKFRPTSPLW
jgi:hypothetical protein